MPNTTQDAITVATKFNEAVEATNVIGTLQAEVRGVREDVREVRDDVKHIRTGMDRWGGVMVVVGAIISLAASLAVAVAGPAISKALLQ